MHNLSFFFLQFLLQIFERKKIILCAISVEKSHNVHGLKNACDKKHWRLFSSPQKNQTLCGHLKNLSMVLRGPRPLAFLEGGDEGESRLLLFPLLA